MKRKDGMMMFKLQHIVIIVCLVLIASTAHTEKVDIEKEIDSYLSIIGASDQAEVVATYDNIRGAYLIKVYDGNVFYTKAIQHKRVRMPRTVDADYDNTSYRTNPGSYRSNTSPMYDNDDVNEIKWRLTNLKNPSYADLETIHSEIIKAFPEPIQDGDEGQEDASYHSLMRVCEGLVIRFIKVATRGRVAGMMPMLISLIEAEVSANDNVGLSTEFSAIEKYTIRFPDTKDYYLKEYDEYYSNIVGSF